jgi:hydroxyacylglutathione hydrolase
VLFERVEPDGLARPILTFCGSGRRSSIAASLLQMAGVMDVTVALGGLKGWSSISCPLEGH